MDYTSIVDAAGNFTPHVQALLDIATLIIVVKVIYFGINKVLDMIDDDRDQAGYFDPDTLKGGRGMGPRDDHW